MSRERTPDTIAFQTAQTLARESAVGNFEQSPIDNDHNEYYDNQETVRTVLARELKKQGATGTYSFDEFRARLNDDDDLTSEVQSLLNHYADAGYFYGLALGLRLGGGAR